MSTNSELRRRARQALEGNWGIAVAATLILLVITGLFGVSVSLVSGNVWWQAGGNLLSVLTLPLTWGFYIFFLDVVRGDGEEHLFRTLFEGYTGGRFLTVLGTMFLMQLYILLWSLLLIVPGIMKSMSYAMTPYILKDNPGISAVDAIHRSRVMMDGHKMKLFVMYLSFIGWVLLCLLTLGLGFLLLGPYVRTSVATFYQDLLEEERKAAAEQEKEEMNTENAQLA